MVISIFRKTSAPNFMLSSWSVDTQSFCVGIELPARPPVPGGFTAIPFGTYHVRTTWSKRLSGLAGHPVFTPQLFDVPGHTTLLHGKPLDECGIRIHSGNVVNGIPAGQPGGPKSPYSPTDPLRTDSKMCLLPGTAVGPDKKSVIGSRAAYAPLAAKIKAAEAAGELITLTIR